MTVNKAMFAEVHRLITEFPELHDQRNWELPAEKSDTCGTTRCIAGWAVWVKAKELGLLDRKRQLTDFEMRDRIREALGIDSIYGTNYDVLGKVILGLDDEVAENLFHDFNQKRALARVKSFATTGEDLPNEKYDRF